MRLRTIFADRVFALRIEKPSYPGAPDDALSQTLAFWQDTDALEEFFLANHDFLCSGYFEKYKLFEAAPEENALYAALLVRRQALAFQELLRQHNDSGSLDELFRFLSNAQYDYQELDLSKAKNDSLPPRWLRLYAIRLAQNCYLITGGAVKLTLEMKDHENTRRALAVIHKTRDWLKENGIFDDDALHEAGLF